MKRVLKSFYRYTLHEIVVKERSAKVSLIKVDSNYLQVFFTKNSANLVVITRYLTRTRGSYNA